MRRSCVRRRLGWGSAKRVPVPREEWLARARWLSNGPLSGTTSFAINYWKWVESGNGSLIIHSTIFAKLNPVSEGLDH